MKIKLNLNKIQEAENVAELLKETQLQEIASQCIDGYKLDEESRAEWQKKTDCIMDMIIQPKEKIKESPFHKASNIKYPLLAQATYDFVSREYKEFIHNKSIVTGGVIGKDPLGSKLRKAKNTAQFMSAKLLFGNMDWEGDVDQLFTTVFISGSVFRKTYFDFDQDDVVSELCHPSRIVVNQNTKDLSSARRVTHILDGIYKNDIITQQRLGYYLDVDIEDFEENSLDCDAPIELLEMHTFLDLDDDGYAEPYIVLLHERSGQILRIVNRFKEIEKNKKGKVVRIIPQEFFTQFINMKSPDGGFYGLGMGQLIYPVNKAINSILNQLVDSGTLANSQSGWYSSSLMQGQHTSRLKFKLNEWKPLDVPVGTKLPENLLPLPVKEPSGTLFKLMQFLVEAGKELSSNTDVMQGRGQTQNVASSTIQQMVEQGSVIFNATHKRLYRSFREEFKKIFELYSMHLTNEKYQKVLDDPEATVMEDFDMESVDIIPVADPSLSSGVQRIAKMQMILQLPGTDQRKASQDMLRVLDLSEEEVQRYISDEPPPPPPEALKIQAEMQELQARAEKQSIEARSILEKVQLEAASIDINKQDADTRQLESASRIDKMIADINVNQAKVQIMASKADHEASLDVIKQVEGENQSHRDLDIKEGKIAVDASKVVVDATKVAKEAKQQKETKK